MNIERNIPVYINYGDSYFSVDGLHRFDRRRSAFKAICMSAVESAVVDEILH